MGNRIIAAVDLGTTKISVLVGEIYSEGRLSIIGRSQSTTVGMQKGHILDVEAVSDCVHAAVESAEKKAEARIDVAYVSQTGAQLSSFRHAGASTVTGPGGVVTGEDVHRAADNARRRELPPGRIYIHHIRSGYLLDGKPVDKPVGLRGEHLEATYWHVAGDEQQVAATLDIMKSNGLNVQDLIVSSLASGCMVALPQDRINGVVVADIGAGTTDFVYYKGDRIIKTGVIPVGGNHITNDLSLGLRINFKQAESLKVRYGKARVDRGDQADEVMLVGDLMIGDRPIPKLAIYKIIQSRVEELFTILSNRLGSLLSENACPSGVILTGGGSNLPMLCEMAESTLGVPVRLGENPVWVQDEELKGREYSTVLGLLYYGLREQISEEDVPMGKTEAKGLIRRVLGIFN